MSSQTPTDLFSSQQWSQLHALIDGLEPHQALWLSGYLAARSLGQSAPAPVGSSAAAKDKISIAFGTETGNCRRLAEDLAKRCGQAGIASEVIDLAQLRVRRLGKMSHIIVITATHGDGEPPEPATPFYEELLGDGAPALKGIKFAVLSLGDSSYEQFCVTGQAIDARLEALGGERLIARQDCDVDFEKPAAAWMEELVAALPSSSQQAAIPAPVSVPQDTASPYSKDNPVLAQVLVNQNLSHPGRRLPVHHLELAVDTAELGLVPGDAVGILAENPPQLVSMVLDATNLSGEQPVTLAGQAMPLVQALRMHCDLTIPGKGFLELWAALSGDTKLHGLVKAELRVQREFLRNHQVRDIIHSAPAHPDAQALVDALRPLQPRLYDVANCLETLPDELHLTVKAYEYPFAGRIESGVATQYLLELDTDTSVPLYPHKNPRFHLPDAAAAPVILVAEGTGIAPYRAFLQTLAQRAEAPPCWLVFAEETFEDDFLYQVDIQQAVTDGVLTHVDSVFYHDQPEATLAQPLLAHSERLLSWLDQGAHVYLCGDKESLDACEASLKHHVDERLGDGRWKRLSGDKRIHRNLY
ncbi:MAG: flavodoxin domain-containing protein [Porticoccaceae bacterium]